MALKQLSLFCLMLLVGFNASATDKSTEMTNSAIGRAPSDINVADPALYYANRVKAIEMVKDNNWQEANLLLQKLTAEFKDDGDTWFALGVTYLELKQWQKAIGAFENALALGARLFGMPGGGANPNDMMIRLAEVYGQMGDEKQAIHWINQALEARWDDRQNWRAEVFLNREKIPTSRHLKPAKLSNGRPVPICHPS